MSQKLAVALLVAITVGCKSGVQFPSFAAKPAAPTPPLAAAEATPPPAADDSGLSIRNLMDLASFMRPAGNDSGLVPPQILQLTATANTVVSQASQLNVNDPPQVTAQKAQAILETLRPWDTLMATAKSMRLIDDETAAPLQAIVDQIKVHSNALIQLGSHPETITAVQHLASQLRMAGGGIVAMFSPAGDR